MITVVGPTFFDTYYELEDFKIDQTAPLVCGRGTATYSFLGGAGNVAAAIAAQGESVLLLTACDRDSLPRLAALCRRSEVELSACETATRVPEKRRFVDSHGRLLFRADEENKHGYLDFADGHKEGWFIDQLLTRRSRCVVFSDYGKGFFSPLDSLTRMIAAAKCTTIVDPQPETIGFCSGATAITPNVAQASAYLGRKARAGSDVWSSNWEKPVELVVLTKGAAGLNAYASKTGTSYSLSVLPRGVVDTTGAGDAIVAGLAMTLGTQPHETALRYATAVADCVVQQPMTAVPHPHLLIQSLGDYDKAWKIVASHTAYEIAESARAHHRKVVVTNGVFDLLHAGHVRVLEEARKQGDLLIVLLNTDASAGRCKPGRPFETFDERAAMVASLGCVTAVAAFDHDTPEAAIRHLQPDVLVKGAAAKAAPVPGDQWAKKLVFVDEVAGYSTTARANKIAMQLRNTTNESSRPRKKAKTKSNTQSRSVKGKGKRR